MNIMTLNLTSQQRNRYLVITYTELFSVDARASKVGSSCRRRWICFSLDLHDCRHQQSSCSEVLHKTFARISLMKALNHSATNGSRGKGPRACRTRAEGARCTLIADAETIKPLPAEHWQIHN